MIYFHIYLVVFLYNKNNILLFLFKDNIHSFILLINLIDKNFFQHVIRKNRYFNNYKMTELKREKQTNKQLRKIYY